MPGPWRTSFIPYAKEPMDSFCDPEIEHLILVFGSQGSKTEILINITGYATDQDPGPMLIVYPEDGTAEFASEARIQPMILSVPALKNKFDQRGSEKLELKFDDVFIALNGANSPSKLSSKPIRYLIRDEIDKYKKWTGDEASPLDLTEERTKTFPHNRKIVDASTPTLTTGNIWTAYQGADKKMKYHVPCPHCGTMQPLIFKQIKWPQDMADIKMVRDLAWYECAHCQGVIEDQHKTLMLAGGKWICENVPPARVRSIAYHVSSIYSPFVTFGEMAYKFLKSKDYPEKLMNFINSWLAEPWEAKATQMRSDIVMTKALAYPRGRVHELAQLLTCGVDVQLNHFWFTVRAWGPDLASWLVDYGRVETWAAVEDVINRNYVTEQGEIKQINLACLDSGFNTDEVYQFCAKNPGVCIPTKGSSRPMRSRYSITVLDKGVGAGLRLYVFDTSQYKDFIAGRLSIAPGAPGAWHVCADTERYYADQVCSEQKVEVKDKKGRVSTEWQLIGSHMANHMLDCENNATVAAEIMGVRYLREEIPLVQSPAAPAPDDQDWIPDTEEDWIK
ncbi:MAG: terminase gpA endonuclease subunit [Negativicutes bacterium]